MQYFKSKVSWYSIEQNTNTIKKGKSVILNLINIYHYGQTARL